MLDATLTNKELPQRKESIHRLFQLLPQRHLQYNPNINRRSHNNPTKQTLPYHKHKRHIFQKLPPGLQFPNRIKLPVSKIHTNIFLHSCM